MQNGNREEHRNPNEENLPARTGGGIGLRRIARHLAGETTVWQPSPLQRPDLHPDLKHLPLLERIVEVLRWHMLRIEYQLSPSGSFREWLLVLLRLLFYFAVPLGMLTFTATVLLIALQVCTATLWKLVLNSLKITAAVLAVVFSVRALRDRGRRQHIRREEIDVTPDGGQESPRQPERDLPRRRIIR